MSSNPHFWAKIDGAFTILAQALFDECQTPEAAFQAGGKIKQALEAYPDFSSKKNLHSELQRLWRLRYAALVLQSRSCDLGPLPARIEDTPTDPWPIKPEDTNFLPESEVSK